VVSWKQLKSINEVKVGRLKQEKFRIKTAAGRVMQARSIVEAGEIRVK
jgi:hypothetical protein